MSAYQVSCLRFAPSHPLHHHVVSGGELRDEFDTQALICMFY